MRVRVFGSFGAIGDGGQVLSVGGPKQRTVLAMLCVEPGRPVSTDRLVEAVWGDEVPDRASRSLSTYVSSLRRELGDVIESGSGSYVLRVDRSQVDSCAFSDAVGAAGRLGGADGVAAYREALLMWTGAPFGGLDGFGAFRDEVQRLAELRVMAERSVIEADIAAGDAVAAVPRIDALVNEFPFDERLRGLHMRALYGAGRQVEALESFNSFKTQLADELGLDPSPELQDLELQILQQDESLTGAPLDQAPLTHDVRRRVPFPGFLTRGHSDALVGREDALVQLDTAYVAALEGTQTIAVVGEPGIGKTTLTATWAERHIDDGAMVVAGRCTPDSALPYEPFIEIARAVLTTQPDRIDSVGPAAGNLALLVPGLDSEDLPPPIQADPDTVEYLMAQAFAAILEPAPGDTATIAILDDLHWADPQSISVLGLLARRTDVLKVLIVANYRDTDLIFSHPLPGLLTDLRRERRLDRLFLDRLSDEQVGEMISAHFGVHASESVVASIAEETRGNPFFVEELTRHLRNENAVDEEGQWVAEIEIEEYGIPEGVRDVIGRRLERLGEDATALLQVGAVIGPVFSIDMAGKIADLAEEQIDAVADAGTAASIIDEDTDTGDFAFAHALVRQTIYDELSTRRRIRLHRAVGEAIESSGGEPEAALRHWTAGNQPDRALVAAIAAAETNRSISSGLEARQHLDLALELWDDVDDPESVTGLTHARLVMLVERTYIQQGGSEQQTGLDIVLAELESTIDLDDATIGRLHSDVASLLWSPGTTTEQTEHHRLAMNLVPPDPPSVDRATVAAHYAAHLMMTGFPEDAIRIGHEALEMARTVDSKDAEEYALSAIATSLGQLGEVQAADQYFDELRLLANRTGTVRTQIVGLIQQGEMNRVVGDLDKALRMGDEGASLAAELGLLDSEKFLEANAAHAALELGRWDEAVRRIELLSAQPLIDSAEMNRLLVSVVIAAERGNRAVLDDGRKRLEEFDLTAEVPEDSGHIWSAFVSDWRWRGDFGHAFNLSTIAIDVHDQIRDWNTSMWLAAYSIELIADGIAAGVGDESWLELAQRWYDLFMQKNPAARVTVALQATSAADIARANGENAPALWRDAIDGWAEGSYHQAKARWRLADVLMETDPDDPDIQANLDLAQDVAEGLGAQPLLNAIEATRVRTGS